MLKFPGGKFLIEEIYNLKSSFNMNDDIICIPDEIYKLYKKEIQNYVKNVWT